MLPMQCFLHNYNTILMVTPPPPVPLRPNAGHGLLILEVYKSRTTTHQSPQDSSGRAISSSQRPLPDNTQHSQQTNIHAPGRIRTHNHSRRAALDRAATGTGINGDLHIKKKNIFGTFMGKSNQRKFQDSIVAFP